MAIAVDLNPITTQLKSKTDDLGYNRPIIAVSLALTSLMYIVYATSIRKAASQGECEGRDYCSTWSPVACAVQTDTLDNAANAFDRRWDPDANNTKDCKCPPGACGTCPCLARAMASLQRPNLYKVLHATTPCQLRPLFSSSVVENQSARGGVECPTDEQHQEKVQLGGNGNASATIDGKTTPSHIYRWRRISLQQVLKRLTSKEREYLMTSPTLSLELANTSWELDRDQFAPSCWAGDMKAMKTRCCGLGPYLQVWDRPTHTASDVIKTLKLHNMSNMVTLGDSVGAQYITAFLTMLERSGMKCEDNYTKSDLFKEKWLALIPAEQRVDLHKSIMKWSYCYFCDGFTIFIIHRQPIEYIGTKDDYLRVVTKYWSDVADVISFNHGLHLKSASAMAGMLDVTLPHLNEFGSKPGKLAIYRETSAQHFSGGTGSYESRAPDATSCAMHADAHPGYRNMLLYRAVKEKFHGIHVEGVWRVSAARNDMHLEANEKGVTDCTHFCFNPFFWEGVFSNLYDELQSVFLKDGRTHQEISSMIKTYEKIGF